jgi:hypothetical protein
VLGVDVLGLQTVLLARRLGRLQESANCKTNVPQVTTARPTNDNSIACLMQLSCRRITAICNSPGLLSRQPRMSVLRSAAQIVEIKLSSLR